MANLKISDMQEVPAVKPADLFYVVQDGISSHITAASLFGKLPDVLLSGSLQLDTIESIVANGGDLSDLHVVNAITVDNIDRVFNLSSGTPQAPLPNFMLKVVYLKTEFGGNAIISGGLITEISSVVLSKIGDSAIFLSTPSGWIYLAGTATVNRV